MEAFINVSHNFENYIALLPEFLRK